MDKETGVSADQRLGKPAGKPLGKPLYALTAPSVNQFHADEISEQPLHPVSYSHGSR